VSKHDNRGRSRGTPHVRLDHSVFYSSSYRALAPVSKAMLWELVGLFNGSNNGDLWLGVRDAAALIGVTDKEAASNALKALMEHGLIAITSGGYFHIKERHATCYRLTWMGAGGRAPTNEWRDWRATPGSRQAKRLNNLAATNLRSGFSALAVRESRTEAAKSTDIHCVPVRETGTVTGNGLVIAGAPSVRISGTHVDHHGGRGQRPSSKDCDDVKMRIQRWLKQAGYGAQGRLAGLAGLTPSKLSRFISGKGGVSVAQLERLEAALQRPSRLEPYQMPRRQGAPEMSLPEAQGQRGGIHTAPCRPC